MYFLLISLLRMMLITLFYMPIQENDNLLNLKDLSDIIVLEIIFLLNEKMKEDESFYFC
jgi:hypothetical protein